MNIVVQMVQEQRTVLMDLIGCKSRSMYRDYSVWSIIKTSIYPKKIKKCVRELCT